MEQQKNIFLDLFLSLVWALLLGGVLTILIIPGTRELFVMSTRTHPYLMGMAKFILLGTMGEQLSRKVVSGKWQLAGIRLWQRALAWGVIGIMMTLAFPLFSGGVDSLLAQGYLPGLGMVWLTAFWKSFFFQAVFGFPFMTFHRITDTLIEKDKLFSKWPLIETYRNIDWDNMFRIIGGSIVWFWLPVQSVNFMLPPEFRVVAAALLAIALGLILGFAKLKAVKKPTT